MTDDPSDVDSREQSGRRRGRLSLFACSLIVLVVWLGLLPRWSQSRSMSRYLEELEQKGIDPSAMFYTELPMMSGLLEQLEGEQR